MITLQTKYDVTVTLGLQDSKNHSTEEKMRRLQEMSLVNNLKIQISGIHAHQPPPHPTDTHPHNSVAHLIHAPSLSCYKDESDSYQLFYTNILMELFNKAFKEHRDF